MKSFAYRKKVNESFVHQTEEKTEKETKEISPEYRKLLALESFIKAQYASVKRLCAQNNLEDNKNISLKIPTTEIYPIAPEEDMYSDDVDGYFLLKYSKKSLKYSYLKIVSKVFSADIIGFDTLLFNEISLKIEDEYGDFIIPIELTEDGELYFDKIDKDIPLGNNWRGKGEYNLGSANLKFEHFPEYAVAFTMATEIVWKNLDKDSVVQDFYQERVNQGLGGIHCSTGALNSAQIKILNTKYHFFDEFRKTYHHILNGMLGMNESFVHQTEEKTEEDIIAENGINLEEILLDVFLNPSKHQDEFKICRSVNSMLKEITFDESPSNKITSKDDIEFLKTSQNGYRKRALESDDVDVSLDGIELNRSWKLMEPQHKLSAAFRVESDYQTFYLSIDFSTLPWPLQLRVFKCCKNDGVYESFVHQTAEVTEDEIKSDNPKKVVCVQTIRDFMMDKVIGSEWYDWRIYDAVDGTRYFPLDDFAIIDIALKHKLRDMSDYYGYPFNMETDSLSMSKIKYNPKTDECRIEFKMESSEYSFFDIELVEELPLIVLEQIVELCKKPKFRNWGILHESFVHQTEEATERELVKKYDFLNNLSQQECIEYLTRLVETKGRLRANSWGVTEKSVQVSPLMCKGSRVDPDKHFVIDIDVYSPECGIDNDWIPYYFDGDEDSPKGLMLDEIFINNSTKRLVSKWGFLKYHKRRRDRIITKKYYQLDVSGQPDYLFSIYKLSEELLRNIVKFLVKKYGWVESVDESFVHQTIEQTEEDTKTKLPYIKDWKEWYDKHEYDVEWDEEDFDYDGFYAQKLFFAEMSDSMYELVRSLLGRLWGLPNPRIIQLKPFFKVVFETNAFGTLRVYTEVQFSVNGMKEYEKFDFTDDDIESEYQTDYNKLKQMASEAVIDRTELR